MPSWGALLLSLGWLLGEAHQRTETYAGDGIQTPRRTCARTQRPLEAPRRQPVHTRCGNTDVKTLLVDGVTGGSADPRCALGTPD